MRRLNRYWTLAWVGMAGSVIAGCEGDIPGSNVVATDKIYADIQVVGGDKTTDVGVLLKEGGEDGTVLPLVPGDSLTASIGGKKTSQFIKDTEGRYHGTLSASATGAEVTVAFERLEAQSASNSTAVLPEAFSLALDMDSDEIARGNNVHIAWDAASSGGDITWSVKGTCIEPATDTTKDDGAVAIGTQQIQVLPSSKDSSCEVGITLERVSEGTLDPKFGKGGKVMAYQRRTVFFTSTPGIEG